MQCAAFERRLQWLLDQRARPEEDDELLEHASGCEVCEQVLHAQSQLFKAIALDLPPEPEEGFACRVMSDFAVEAPPPQRPARFPWGIIAAIAATILLAALPFWLLRDSPAPKPPVAHAPTSAAPMPERATTPWDPEAAEIGPWLQKWAQNLSDPSIEELETVDQLSGGIRSLTSTITVAIDTLRRNMPVNHEAMLEKPPADSTRPAWLPQLGWLDRVTLAS